MTLLQNKFLRLLLSTATLLGAIQIAALESDAEQEIKFQSDGGSTMRLEGESRIWVWTENVVVTQGSLEITGDEAILELDAETSEMLRVTVHGSPVTYQQQLDETGALVTGSSLTIEFYRDDVDQDLVIELTGEAKISSPDTTMSCASITYLADRDLIRDAEGRCQGSFSPSSN